MYQTFSILKYCGCCLVNILGGLDDRLNMEIAGSASWKTTIIFPFQKRSSIFLIQQYLDIQHVIQPFQNFPSLYGGLDIGYRLIWKWGSVFEGIRLGDGKIYIVLNFLFCIHYLYQLSKFWCSLFCTLNQLLSKKIFMIFLCLSSISI